MTPREARQRRLLHVRTLQADLAAAQLRLLRSEQQEDHARLAEVQLRVHTSAATAAGNGEWLFYSAERTVLALQAERLIEGIGARQPGIETAAVEEAARRQGREQMQRLADKTAADAGVQQGHIDQARLDDLFSAVRLGRMRHPNDS